MKVNSYLFAAASATILLASCSNSDVVEMPSGRAIGFGTYVSNTARAAVETDLSFLKGENGGFYVFGQYKDGADLRTVFDGKSDGSKVTWNASSWGYSPINYWLDGKKYQFAAYGPQAAYNVGTPSFDYESNKLSIEDYVANGSTDLVVAEGNNIGYTTVEGTPAEPVSFKFFHALSKVKFTLVNGWRNNVTLTLSEIKLAGALSTGSLTTSGTLNNTPAGSASPMPSTAWTGQNTAREYSDAEGFVSDEYNTKHEFESFLLPQTLTENDNLILSFTAKVNNMTGSGPDLGAGAGNPVTKEVKIPYDVVASWEPGKAYNYTLVIDGSTFDLKPIQFDNITVEVWASGVEDELVRDDIKD